jgi:hypothetical protein
VRRQTLRFLGALAAGGLVAILAMRLSVRPGRADAPAGRYQVDTVGGTVTDTATGLVWQRTGPTGNMPWDAARTYCSAPPSLPGAGWRLPTMKELLTLIDDSATGSTKIDGTAFPGTVTNPPYWSSSDLAILTTRAWVVGFGNGYTNDAGKASFTARVRCVR